jgi:hypothetical protein
VFWARINMLYDKHVGYPELDSPLETLFMMVWLQRQQQQLLSMQAMIAAIRAGDSDEANEAVIKAFDDFCEKMFPFYARATESKIEKQKQALQDFIKKPLRIKMADIYAAKTSTLKKINRTIQRRAGKQPQQASARPASIPQRFRAIPK